MSTPQYCCLLINSANMGIPHNNQRPFNIFNYSTCGVNRRTRTVLNCVFYGSILLRFSHFWPVRKKKSNNMKKKIHVISINTWISHDCLPFMTWFVLKHQTASLTQKHFILFISKFKNIYKNCRTSTYIFHHRCL